MAVEDNVGQAQIRAFVERIERLEEEKAALAADIKEIYAEAKGNGFDTKILRKVVTIRKQDVNERMEQEALLDLYMGALGMIAEPTEDEIEERARLNRLAAQVENAGKQKADPTADLRANPSLHIVSASEIKPKSEPQPLTQAGSDLTTPQALNGQVATHPEAKTSTDGGTTEQDIGLPADSVTGEASRASVGAGSDAPIQPETADDCPQPPETDQRLSVAGPKDTAGRQSADTLRAERGRPGDGVTAGETAPKYAAPGIVTWETYPPEGVTRSAVSIAFANIGQDAVLIKDELANGKAQPIVKIGREILDGWARFMTARDMTEMDGKPLAYAVVQYAGTDPLIDAIKLNVEGRVLDEGQKRKIAATLVRQNPSRKDDIYRAFELWMEPV